jgi:feruloyl-CoA synthase
VDYRDHSVLHIGKDTMSPTFSSPRIRSERLPDGRLLLRSTEPLGDHPVSVVHSFRAHAEAHPDRLLVAERAGGGWARSTWGEVRVQADRLAQGLLDRGLADRPVMVLSGNSRLHLVVTLAAMTVGAPVVPASVAYSLQSADHAKLRAMADLVDPGLMVAEDASFGPAVDAVGGGRTVLGRDLPRALTPDDLPGGFGAEPTGEAPTPGGWSTGAAPPCSAPTSPRSSSPRAPPAA